MATGSSGTGGRGRSTTRKSSTNENTGGTTMTVRAGDFLQIPAGMPHLFNVASGGTFRYVVFNTRQ